MAPWNCCWILFVHQGNVVFWLAMQPSHLYQGSRRDGFWHRDCLLCSVVSFLCEEDLTTLVATPLWLLGSTLRLFSFRFRQSRMQLERFSYCGNSVIAFRQSRLQLERPSFSARLLSFRFQAEPPATGTSELLGSLPLPVSHRLQFGKVSLSLRA